MSISVIEPMRLLEPDELPPVLELNRQGQSDFVIVVDHASRVIPRRLGTLGLPDSELRRHIAWDIGSLAVAHYAAVELDAHLVAQNYSRLVIDCNRPPNAETSIPAIAEDIGIPGNIGLSKEQIAARRREIFDPYHDHLQALLDKRKSAGRGSILVAQHSMTDVFKGARRKMHAAVMYHRDPSFAKLVLKALRQEPGLIIADNEPYFVSDSTDFTIPVHGEARHLRHVAIEIRQDLIADEAGQKAWGKRISRALQTAEQALTRVS